MAKLYGDVEIALTIVELQQALGAWLGSKTTFYDGRVTGVALKPGAKYCVRFTVQPPLSKAEKEAVTRSVEAADDAVADREAVNN